MKSKYIGFVVLCIGIVLLFLLINRFTIVNLNFLAKSSKKIPDLSQTLKNDYYEIEKISDGVWNEIRYDPVNDFYIVVENDKITKLNNKGNTTFILDMNEKDFSDMPDFMDYHRPSCYVISWYGIYDISKEHPYLEKFDKRLNDDGKMEWEEWMKQFNHLYNTSEVVLWGYKKSLDASRSHPLYFKQNGKWKILYTLKNVSQINTNNTFTKFRLNYTQAFLADKFNKLYLLKDIQKENAYSDYNNLDNEYDNKEYAENHMVYGKEANIETISFEKEVIMDATYSYMPANFGGTVINKLTIANNHFTFKAKAIKGAGFNTEPLETYFYLFTVPTKFKTKTTLNFLYYKYPTNWNSDENEGVYVIKKRNE